MNNYTSIKWTPRRMNKVLENYMILRSMDQNSEPRNKPTHLWECKEYTNIQRIYRCKEYTDVQTTKTTQTYVHKYTKEGKIDNKKNSVFKK